MNGVAVAADISHCAPGPGAWRRWHLRRVTPAAIAPLHAALTDLAARRRALEARIDDLDAYIHLLADGIVAGSVTLTDPAAQPASDPQ